MTKADLLISRLSAAAMHSHRLQFITSDFNVPSPSGAKTDDVYGPKRHRGRQGLVAVRSVISLLVTGPFHSRSMDSAAAIKPEVLSSGHTGNARRH